MTVHVVEVCMDCEEPWTDDHVCATASALSDVIDLCNGIKAHHQRLEREEISNTILLNAPPVMPIEEHQALVELHRRPLVPAEVDEALASMKPAAPMVGELAPVRRDEVYSWNHEAYLRQAYDVSNVQSMVRGSAEEPFASTVNPNPAVWVDRTVAEQLEHGLELLKPAGKP